MSLNDFIQQARDRINIHGYRVIPSICVDAGKLLIGKTPYIGKVGTNVFSKDWDILVVLDACRLDMYKESINADAKSIWSVGSHSTEWLANTFAEADTIDTIYITGNVFSKDYLENDEFHQLVEVWRDGWDDNKGTIPPRAITNEAIRSWRKHDAERMIVHYMQPHFPAIGSEIEFGGGVSLDKVGDETGGIWDQMRYEDLDSELAWQAYRDNLNFVWEDVKLLMENVNGTVTITADHGNCFGELATYGHPAGLPWPQLRQVPWDTYICVDKMTHIPEPVTDDNTPEASVEDRLESLGYV
jgi:hypothetical protein